MLAVPTIDLLLLDFDGLLVRYCHRTRLRELAARAGTDTARIQQQLFDSGLERAHDGGGLDSDGYLRQLHARLPHRLSRQDWLQARLAATTLQPGMLTLLEQAARQQPLALLSNNNAWLSELLAALSPDLPPLFEGRVLSSAALGQRKPAARAFLCAVQQLQLQPQRVLFVDDLFVNVRGARQAGLHAETAADSASLSRILRRYRLL